MSNITVKSHVDAIITLNKTGVPIRGRATIVLNLDTPDKENEVSSLIRAGLLEVLPSLPSPLTPPSVTLSPLPPALEVKQPVSEPAKVEQAVEKTAEKKKGGRPKGSKNKSKNPQAEEEFKRVSKAEARTQEMGSRVIVGTPDGAKVGRMTRSAVNDIVESEQTRASLEAMEKLQREEDEDINLPDTVIDESKLDASEQMGRKAVIATPGGAQGVDMVNSIVPEAKQCKEADPFIDREDKEAEKRAAAELFVKKAAEKHLDDDDVGDAFVEI